MQYAYLGDKMIDLLPNVLLGVFYSHKEMFMPYVGFNLE